jgi:hypothetical protein
VDTPPLEDVGGGGFDPSSALDRCAGSAKGGHWAVELSTVKEVLRRGELDQLRLTYRLVHLSPSGARSEGKAQSYWVSAYEVHNAPDTPIDFDFDGDGAAEVVLPVRSSDHAGSSKTTYRAFVDEAGKHAALLPGVLEVLDAHDDGDNQLLLFSFKRGTGSSWLAAHVLENGELTFADDAAIAETRRSCPLRLPASVKSIAWVAGVACKACSACGQTP